MALFQNVSALIGAVLAFALLRIIVETAIRALRDE